jgi:hypothetical protein
MSRQVTIRLEVPDALKDFHLPKAINRRLHDLLDRQDRGERLTRAERREAEAMVDMTHMLSLLRARAESASNDQETNT